MKQRTFASLAFEQKKRAMRRERFLAEMKTVVPWPALLAVLEPHYPKSRVLGATTNAARDGAADQHHKAVLCAVGSGDGGRAQQDRIDASLCLVGTRE